MDGICIVAGDRKKREKETAWKKRFKIILPQIFPSRASSGVSKGKNECHSWGGAMQSEGERRTGRLGK